MYREVVKSLTGKTKGMVGVVTQVYSATLPECLRVTFSYGIGKRSYWIHKDNLKVIGREKIEGDSGGGATT